MLLPCVRSPCILRRLPNAYMYVPAAVATFMFSCRMSPPLEMFPRYLKQRIIPKRQALHTAATPPALLAAHHQPYSSIACAAVSFAAARLAFRDAPLARVPRFGLPLLAAACVSPSPSITVLDVLLSSPTSPLLPAMRPSASLPPPPAMPLLPSPLLLPPPPPPPALLGARRAKE